jgi:hypothetical protein
MIVKKMFNPRKYGFSADLVIMAGQFYEGRKNDEQEKEINARRKIAKEIKKLKKHNKIHRISTFLKSIKINGK